MEEWVAKTKHPLRYTLPLVERATSVLLLTPHLLISNLHKDRTKAKVFSVEFPHTNLLNINRTNSVALAETSPTVEDMANKPIALKETKCTVVADNNSSMLTNMIDNPLKDLLTNNLHLGMSNLNLITLHSVKE